MVLPCGEVFPLFLCHVILTFTTFWFFLSFPGTVYSFLYVFMSSNLVPMFTPESSPLRQNGEPQEESDQQDFSICCPLNEKWAETVRNLRKAPPFFLPLTSRVSQSTRQNVASLWLYECLSLNTDLHSLGPCYQIPENAAGWLRRPSLV
jgi:hypothetical protein